MAYLVNAYEVVAMNWLFTNRSAQKLLLVSALAIGTAGLLSGVWLAAEGDTSSLAGLIGGIVTFAIGWFGLRSLRHTRFT